MFIILPILVKYFKLHDMSVVMLASVSAVLRSLIFCFATNLDMLYTTLCLSLFDNLGSQPLRSYLTKIVGSADAGKVFLKQQNSDLKKIFSGFCSCWITSSCDGFCFSNIQHNLYQHLGLLCWYCLPGYLWCFCRTLGSSWVHILLPSESWLKNYHWASVSYKLWQYILKVSALKKWKT